MLHTESFATSKTAALRRIPYRPTKEKVDADFPLMLNTGRTLYHFNAGTMTYRTGLNDIRPYDYLEISAEDAEGLWIAEGEEVRVVSKYGEVTMPVHISPRVRLGELFATFHKPEQLINRVTSRHRDRYVQAPEFKVTAVRVEKIGTFE